MRNNGNNRTRDYAAEIAFHQKIRAVPPAARPDLLAWLRRAHAVPERSGGSHRPLAPPLASIDN